MSLPRLTGAIRAFSTVTAKYEPESYDVESLDSKRRQKHRHESSASETTLSWKDLAQVISNNSATSKESLHQLLSSAKEIVGLDTDSDVLEEAAVFLFMTFRDSKLVTQKDVSALKDYFGPVELHTASQAQSVIKRLVSSLSNDGLQQIDNLATHVESESESDEFGKNIKFCPASSKSLANVSWLESSDDEVTSSSVAAGFDMQYKHAATTSSVEPAECYAMSGAEWLKCELKKFYAESETGMSVEDLTTTIFDVLCLPKPNESLQNDLFDLLGFERFEFIESLLENRQRVISVVTEPERSLQPRTEPTRTEPTRPNYGCQVIVQTQEEKQLQKLLRRGEKKLAKKKKVPTATLR